MPTRDGRQTDAVATYRRATEAVARLNILLEIARTQTLVAPVTTGDGGRALPASAPRDPCSARDAGRDGLELACATGDEALVREGDTITRSCRRAIAAHGAGGGRTGARSLHAGADHIRASRSAFLASNSAGVMRPASRISAKARSDATWSTGGTTGAATSLCKFETKQFTLEAAAMIVVTA